MTRIIRDLVVLASLTLSLVPSINAHMEMKQPYPFRSKFNPSNNDPDYSNTSPLADSGSNYPCKGYHNLPASQNVVATYNPGQTYHLILDGSASHDGGSCQISLSYDNGQTFRVIKSMIGGCPLKLDWEFTIPENAPPSQNVIFAWTWFNHKGNREMYMQCARVAVGGKPVQRYRRTTNKRQSSFDELPEIYKCNIGNDCKTDEVGTIDFPNRGNTVEYGNDTNTNNGDHPVSSATFVSSLPISTPLAPSLVPGEFYASGDGYTSTTLNTNKTPSPTPATSSDPLPPSLSTTTSRISATVVTSPIINAPTPTLIPGSCTPGAIICNSSSSWSQCVTSVSLSGELGSTQIHMGLVAAGMQCVNGQIVRNDASGR